MYLLHKPIFIMIITTLLLLSTPNPVLSGSDLQLSEWVVTSGGTIGDFLGEDAEFEMDSETNRRILATKRYISYGALKKNNVPCSRRGASYYNCKKGAQANPYSRGCSKISKCRS